MGEANRPASTPMITPWPNLDPGLWSLLTGMIWLLILILFVVAFRGQIMALLNAIILRVRSGATIKLFSVELGQIRVPQPSAPSNNLIDSEIDTSGRWRESRDRVYNDNRRVFVVHRLFPSEIPGALYDIIIYVKAHEDRGGTLEHVDRVEYYFGDAFGNQVFTARDKGKRFAVVVYAYGKGFLCTTRIFFKKDGGIIDSWRYIDFEAGPLGEGGAALSAGDDASS